MRTFTNLITPGTYVYVHFKDKDLCRQFLQQAEWEGFTIGEGGKPTDIELTEVLAILPEKKLCHLGWASHMAYHANPKNMTRVEYEKYINGERKYECSLQTYKKMVGHIPFVPFWPVIQAKNEI